MDQDVGPYGDSRQDNSRPGRNKCLDKKMMLPIIVAENRGIFYMDIEPMVQLSSNLKQSLFVNSINLVGMPMFSIALAIFLWLINPRDIQTKIKQLFPRTIDTKILHQGIHKLKLGIENETLLSGKKFINSNKYVFFPVVPNKSPNIIHVTFINVIKGLESLGLHVFVFIYDDYFGRVRNYNQKEKMSFINDFSKYLIDMGINKSQMIYESNIIKNKSKTNKIFQRFLYFSSTLSIQEINYLEIVNNHYVDANTKYIRKFKSFLNMLYLECISSKIGFVLSGKDEIALWQTYEKYFDNRIIHLYIDKYYNQINELGNILDDNNLSYGDSLETLKEKITKVLNGYEYYGTNMRDTNIFYLFSRNFYNIEGNTLKFQAPNDNILEISSVDKLLEYCIKHTQNGLIDIYILDILAETAYNIFHPIGGK
jgi:hypothetical protein